MAEKLAKLAKERLIKVANGGTSSGARPLPADSTVLQPGAFMYVFRSAGTWQTYKPTPRLSISVPYDRSTYDARLHCPHLGGISQFSSELRFE